MDAGLWTLASGRWHLHAGLWTLDSGRWTLEAGPRALNARLWTLKLLNLKLSKALEGSISITSISNSALIKIFSNFRYENLSMVYSFQVTLSDHLEVSETWWCGEGSLVWNGLIWSFVSVKAQTMRYIFAVNFFRFFKHVDEQKKWFIWIRTLQLLPKNSKIYRTYCINLSQPYQNFWCLDIYVQLLSERGG